MIPTIKFIILVKKAPPLPHILDELTKDYKSCKKMTNSLRRPIEYHEESYTPPNESYNPVDKLKIRYMKRTGDQTSYSTEILSGDEKLFLVTCKFPKGETTGCHSDEKTAKNIAAHKGINFKSEVCRFKAQNLPFKAEELDAIKNDLFSSLYEEDCFPYKVQLTVQYGRNCVISIDTLKLELTKLLVDKFANVFKKVLCRYSYHSYHSEFSTWLDLRCADDRGNFSIEFCDDSDNLKCSKKSFDFIWPRSAEFTKPTTNGSGYNRNCPSRQNQPYELCADKILCLDVDITNLKNRHFRNHDYYYWKFGFTRGLPYHITIDTTGKCWKLTIIARDQLTMSIIASKEKVKIQNMIFVKIIRFPL